MQKLFLTGLLLGLLSFSFAQAEGNPAIIKFKAVDGREVDVAKLKGKVVLIDFWATWCPPCRAIAPALVDAYKKYHDQGLEIVGISGDTDKQALLSYIKKEGAPWPQFFDDSGTDSRFAEAFNVSVIPTFILVDREGKVVSTDLAMSWIGPFGIGDVGPESSGTKKFDAALEKYLKKS